MRPSLRLLATLVAAIALLPVAGAAADPFPVTSLADDGSGSLREAIEGANARPGADSIPIDVTGTIELERALPPILNSLSIIGPGASELTIERKAGSEPFRVLTFEDDFPSVVRDVTISGGLDPLGAGILSEAESLMLIGVMVSGNEARAEGGAQAVARGGGVAGIGALTVLESTISGNDAVAEAGDSQTLATGGGINVTGTLRLERSTVSGNSARAVGPAGDATLAAGGGVHGGQLDVVSSTITGNGSASDGLALGANLASTAPGLLRNTIVSDPQGEAGSCGGPLTSGGFNVDEDGSCGLGASTDLANFTAGLDPVLRENGGPTPTHALLAGSIAIDRGNSFGGTSDQRGLPRPVDFPTRSNTEGGDGSDIGAFELQAPAQTIQPPAPALRVSLVPGDRTPPQTRIVSGPARAGFERLAEFRFTATEPQSRFQCKVDKRRWRGCASPLRRRVGAARGAGRKHVFKVRAIDRFGNADPTPARFGWRVKKVVG
jgi:hypothetical protein